MIDNIFKPKYRTKAEIVKAAKETIWEFSVDIDGANNIIFLTSDLTNDNIITGNLKQIQNQVKKITSSDKDNFWFCNIYMPEDINEIIYDVWKKEFFIRRVVVKIH